MESAGRATIDDLPVIVELARAAIAEKTDTRGGELWQRREARREPIEDSFVIGDARKLVISGRIDDVVVGYAAAHLEDLPDGATLAVITDLYTLPEARGVGVGEVMMEAVLGWCEDENCIGVDSVALPGDRHTKNFFETFGLVARAIVVHRRLA